MTAENTRRAQTLATLAGALALTFALSLLLGRYPAPGLISPAQLAQDDLAQALVFNLRLPRMIAAVLLGMSLGAAGMVFQLLFANPLVEPGFLGVSQGAAFGAAFAIVLLGNAAALTQSGAILAALAGLGLSHTLARRLRFGGWTLRLVLSGIAVSALFSAGVGVLKYIADPLTQLPEITFWLLGGLAGVTWNKLLGVLPAALAGLIAMALFRWRLNVLALDEQTAFSLGAAPARERLALIVAAVLPTAVLISISGIVSWVGLIVPHLARRLLQTDARYSLPGAILLGGLFTLLCDNIARALLAGEIPLGILTALLGALIFLGLMTRPQTQGAS